MVIVCSFVHPRTLHNDCEFRLSNVCLNQPNESRMRATQPGVTGAVTSTGTIAPVCLDIACCESYTCLCDWMGGRCLFFSWLVGWFVGWLVGLMHWQVVGLQEGADSYACVCFLQECFGAKNNSKTQRGFRYIVSRRSGEILLFETVHRGIWSYQSKNS
jgi:hypothetical protein